MQLAARPAADADLALHDALAGIAAAAAAGARIAVLPECTYPGYVLLRAALPGGDAAAERALRTIAAAAKRGRIAVCIGIARRSADGRLRNEAVFIDAAGDAIARHAKMLLWNFDASWFAPGSDVLPFDTEFGRLGMMICADGRMPEIARTLAQRGAWLVLDPTAWVGNGSAYDRMHNPQVEYVMRVRARENGIWIAAADKCRSEHAAVHYVGQSMIVAPDGAIVARAGADAPAIIVADVTRRPGVHPFVAALTSTERAALSALRPHPPKGARVRQHGECRIGVLQGPMGGERRAAIAALRAQGAHVVVETTRSARVITSALSRACGLRASAVEGADMFAPEKPRAAALAGADVLVWMRPPRDALVTEFARTRALENRVFVLVCACAGDAIASMLVDPAGAVTSAALTGVPCGFLATLDPSTARTKRVVPGTDAFAARVPRAFALALGAKR